MRTTIYGYIEEMQFWQDPIKAKVRMHNNDAINALPFADKWPPVSREMFSICENSSIDTGPVLDYGGRIIHFGANLKSVEYEWPEWKSKFEDLLLKLLFVEAKVHFQTEYSELTTSSWSVDLLRYKVLHDGNMPIPITKNDWDYESDYK